MSEKEVCKTCGTCPTCGRGPSQVIVWPQPTTWPQPYVYPWWTTTSAPLVTYGNYSTTNSSLMEGAN